MVDNGTASNYAVNGSAGTIVNPAGSGRLAYLAGVSAPSADAVVSFGLDKIANGSGAYLSTHSRRITGQGSYGAKAQVTSTGAVTLALSRTNSAGTETVIQAPITISGLAYAVGDRLTVRVQAVGANPTTVRAKVWKAGTSSRRPGSAGDRQHGRAAGRRHVGLSAYVSSGATNGAEHLQSTSCSSPPTCGLHRRTAQPARRRVVITVRTIVDRPGRSCGEEVLGTGQREAALQELHDRHAAEFWRFAMRLTHDRQLSEDVVQEVLLKAWKDPGLGERDESAARAWLFTASRNLIIDRWRSAANRHEFATEEPVERQTADASSVVLDRWLIAEALSGLSLEHRTVISAAYYEGRSVADISARLHIPEGTVKSRLHYGLRTLKLILQEKGVTRP